MMLCVRLVRLVFRADVSVVIWFSFVVRVDI